MDLVGPATHMLRLGANRPQGTAVVDVFTPTIAGNEWTCGHTVVQVITDDMPFLLDSVVAAITAQGRSLHLVAHPIFAVERDVAGGLRAVLPVGPDDAPESATRESWIHLEIDLVTDPQAHHALEEALHSVLRDVREAVEDWQRMTSQALELADELRAEPPASVAAKYSDEAAEFLQWLGEGQFHVPRVPHVRPGARPRPRGAGQPAGDRSRAAALGPHPVAVVLGHATRGAGACHRAPGAGAHQGEFAVHSAPPGAAGLRGGQALRRRRAGHRRAPLHRTVHLQHLQPVRHADPGAAPPRRGVVRTHRLPRQQPQRQGPAAVLRDLPARRLLPDRRGGTVPDRARRATDPSAPADAAVRPPRPLRPLRLGTGVPAPGPLQHDGSRAGPEHAAARPTAARPWITPRCSPSRCSPGCTSWCTCRRGHLSPRSTKSRWSGNWPMRCGPGSDLLMDALVTAVGEERAGELAAKYYAARSQRRTRRTRWPARPWRTS